MDLAALTGRLPIQLIRGPASAEVSSIIEDSRRAEPGCLFVARRGCTVHGRDYIAEAVSRGVTAVLVGTGEPVPETPPGVSLLSSPDATATLGHLAERVHGRPSEALKLVGVTGTNGKTTVSHMVHDVLGRTGLRCGLIGTVHVNDGRGPAPARMTTPPAIEASRHLAAMVANHCSAAVMEVSSHALHQGRTAGLAFDVGVFTNLSGEHIDYHGTIDAYAQAKATLFRALPATGFAVINADDPAAAAMTRRCTATILDCSATDAGATCFAQVRGSTVHWIDATFRGPWGSFEARLPLAGTHNVFNALQAAAAGFALGVGSATLQGALEHCTAPPGRLEPVPDPAGELTVLVDYAHTDAALDNVLRSLRPLVPDGSRLRVVFGCGGDRDRTKRPRMGRVAALADDLIVTSDNPRTEEPRAIIDEIVEGIPPDRRADTLVVVNRGGAIEAAVAGAGPGDIVLIAGKGHEPTQTIGTEARPFDDRRVAAAALARGREAATA